MRLNTITFDANLPTTQQINVPTNTDYKVGLKVKRNGEIQQLGPDEFTIYTGETAKEPDDTLGPTEVETLQNTLSSAAAGWTGKTLVSAPSSALSSYDGQTIDVDSFTIEMSEDNGATWATIENPKISPYFRPDNGYANLYGINIVNGVWSLSYPGGTQPIGKIWKIGEFALEQTYNWPVKLEWKANANDQLSAYCNGVVPSSEHPVLVRISMTIDGKTYPVTIPTDADKTNGYVTFTQASNDEPSFRQLKVAIEHGYDYNDSVKATGQFPSTSPSVNPSIVAKTAGELGLAGLEIHASDYGRISSKYWRKNTPAPEDINEWDTINLWTGQATQILKLALTPTGAAKYRSVYHSLIDYTVPESSTVVPELVGFTFKTGEYYFVESDLVGAEYKLSKITQTKTFEADETMLYAGGLRFSANYYWGRIISMAFGTPFSANFKLNVNEFKSQQGDISVSGGEIAGTTKNFSGTFADGTEFSYDVYVKEG